MKKVTYFLVFAISMFVFTSCEDEPVNPTPDPTTITIDQLVGDWNFESVEIDGITYTECSEVTIGLQSFLNVVKTGDNSGSLTEEFKCDGATFDWEFTLVNNEINLGDGNGYQGQIVNAETFDGTVLKIKQKDYNRIITLRHSN